MNSLDYALGFLLVGLTIFAVVLYLRFQSNRLKNYILTLYQINQKVDQDVLDFIDQSWAVLALSGFSGLKGEINWFGEEKSVLYGDTSTSEGYSISFDSGDIQVDLQLYSSKLHGEQLLLANIVYQTFQSLIYQGMSAKNTQVLLSQKRLEKYQLFVQHDIKNLAQFVELLYGQVKKVKTDEDKLLLVDRLKLMLPAFSEKAKKTVFQMTQSDLQFNDVQRLDYRLELKKIAQGLGLQFQIEGDYSMELSKSLFEQVMKSVMENFRDHYTEDKRVFIYISVEGEVVSWVTVSEDEQVAVDFARLFEPFWTTSESGMGLGLFIARELLKKVSGRIKLMNEQGCFGFQVLFKADD